jgi:hypothetical protein
MAKGELTIEMLRPSQIQVDHQYQRPLNRDHVNRIIRQFDPMAIGSIDVSKRDDGSYWVVDGQHRLAALIEMGRGDRPIPCVIYTGLSVGEEADLFFMQSRNRRIHPIDLYKARRFAGDRVVMAISEVVEKHGFRITNEGRDGSVLQAPGLLEQIASNHGMKRLDEVLGLVAAIWFQDRVSVPAYLIGGINAILTRYPTIDRERLVKVLRQQPFDELAASAKSMRKFMYDKSHNIYGRAMAHTYNKGLRQKLPDWDSTLEAVNLANIAKATAASAEAAHAKEQRKVS